MATFERLQISMVAVTSDICSGVTGKPEVSRTRILRPGTEDRFLARLRSDRIMSRAPKSDLAVLSCVPARVVTSFGETDAILIPEVAAFSRSTSSVKFWLICRPPLKLTTAMTLLGPAFDSMNFVAACRARACSPKSIVELSKNRTRYRFCELLGEAGSASNEKLVIFCSLLSSQTLKSFSVRSRLYAPFLSVTTASTSTTFVSVRITFPESEGAGCCARSIPPGSKNRIDRINERPDFTLILPITESGRRHYAPPSFAPRRPGPPAAQHKCPVQRRSLS